MNPQKSKTAISIAIFVVFAVLIEKYIGWMSILAPWKQLSMLTIAGAMLLVFGSYIMRAFRIYYFYLRHYPVRVSACIKLTLLHNFYNNLLPMRSGELAFPILMSRYFAIPVDKSVPGLLWFRLLDLHSLGMVALVSLLTLTMGIGPAALITLPFWVIPLLMFAWSGRLLKNLDSQSSSRISRLLFKLLHGLPTDSRQFWHSWFWTLANWAVKLAAFTWIFTLFVEASPSQSVLGIIGGELTSVLPIHGVAGLGTYEAGIVAAMLPFGLEPKALLSGAVNLHLFLLSVTLIIGLTAILLPLSKNQITENV